MKWGIVTGRRIHCLALFLLALLLLFSALPVRAAGRTVRVGCYLLKGLLEVDEEGNYSGYNYEYLEEIANFTGWRYEFVEVPGSPDESFGTMLEMLRKGELDLLGGMALSPELAEQYGYPGLNCGTAHTILKAPEDSSLDESSYAAYPNLRIAVPETARMRLAELEAHADLLGMEYTVIPCADEAEMLAALAEGRADVLLTRDVGAPDGLRTIAKFAPQPFYFATTKGNTALLTELDAALMQIGEVNPAFALSLCEKYFETPRTLLTLSQEERAWAARAEPIRVAVDSGNAPIQSCDEQGNCWGITADMLDRISEQTGLRFELVPVDSKEEIYARLEAGTEKLGAGLAENVYFTRNTGVTLTEPYLSTQIVMAVSNRINPEEITGKRLALAVGQRFEGEYRGTVQWYNTPEQCLWALRGRPGRLYLQQRLSAGILLKAALHAESNHSGAAVGPGTGNLLRSVQVLCSRTADDSEQGDPEYLL